MQNSGNNDCFGNVRAIARREFFLRWGRRFAACIVFALLAFGAYRVYGAWREKHLAKQTQEFFDRGDYKSAVLVARHVLQLNPNNLAACRIMAKTAEIAGRSEALSWRQHIAALEPNVPENAIELAAAALRAGLIDLAHKVLEAIAPSARTSVKYHQLAGALAVAEKQPALAESHFVAALQLEPENPQLALNLAAVRLASTDTATNEKARTELVRLAEKSTLRLDALRALASDALARNSRVSAERWAAQLKSEKGATLGDTLLYLEATQGTDSARPALLEAQLKANQSSATAAGLITWMNRHGMAKAALAWGLTLPKQVLDAQPLPLALAESQSFLQDWPALQAWVEGKNWGEYECFRLAVQSHALHRLTPADRPSMESETAWRGALTRATSRRRDRCWPSSTTPWSGRRPIAAGSRRRGSPRSPMSFPAGAAIAWARTRCSACATSSSAPSTAWSNASLPPASSNSNFSSGQLKVGISSAPS